ncbi:MAG: hypothetical protein H0U95_02765 [Bacteroidetes bacterium]|nr:hypothetical protein [Bacteroidota bacterium]
MKKLFFSFAFLFISTIIFSQADTLFLQKNKKVACKIFEINDSEIKYKMAGNIDGPIYIIDKSTVTKYTLSNGFTELIMPDELSIEHEHKEIIGNRQVIKISPFGFAFNHISFGYESVIKVGMNLDIQAGYINSEINSDAAKMYSSGMNNSTHHAGFYFKPGVKFFLGEDFSIKGLKYAHPLKGRYIKLDLAVSYINFQDLSLVYYSQNNYPYNGVQTIRTVYSNLNTIAYGGFVNYGRQFILGNILTLDYYVGMGFTGQSETYSNPDFFTNPFGTNNQQYYYAGKERNYTSNYYGFLRIPTVGLSFTGGFRIGYIIPSKNLRKKPLTKN